VPFLGSVVSTAFVNLNTLTQQISDRRQGLANSIYRTIYAVTGIIAPVVVTGLAIVFGGYSGVLILLACLLAVSAATLFAYPGESVPSSLGSIRLEAERMWHGYRTITKKRPLMKFFHLSLGWGALLTSVGTFAAIRFTRELGLSDQQFGTLSAVAGTLTLTVTMLFALILDRVSLRKIHIPAMLAASSFAILMGLGDSLVLSIIGFLGFGPIAGVMIAPSSMWVGRAAGPDSLTAGFSVHKVLMSFYVALASALFGILEHLIGIRLVLLATGIAGLPLALAFIRLHEPSSHNA
jgi:MFS family permease